MICNICPRKCSVDRATKIGYCGVGEQPVLAKAMLHEWEEPIISGTRGSGAIFFSGCNLKCVYCQNYEVSHGKGKIVSVRRLADIFKELEDKGAHNINLVTASHYIDAVKSALDIYRPNVPIVFNCGGYESENAINSLKGYIDVYLPDFKYADNAIAKKYSNASNYFECASKAISLMRKQVGEDIVKDGLMKKGMLIRHLVLPNHIDNSLQVIDWFNENLAKDSYISIMGQFCPMGRAKEFAELSRPLKPLEYKLVVSRVEKYGFNNVYIQDLSSGDEKYTPDFDYQGV